MQNFLCKIKIHKYHIIETDSTVRIRNNTNGLHKGIRHKTGKKLVKKVCLQCGNKVDQITPYIELCERLFNLEIEKSQKAHRLFFGKKDTDILHLKNKE